MILVCAVEYRGPRNAKTFMRYCCAKINIEQKRETYRIYVTDALKTIVENTARFAGGMRLDVRYVDLFKTQDNRTADEIVADVIKKAGLVVTD